MAKFFELNSIRSRMVSGFLFLTLLIVILAVVSWFVLNENNDTARVHGNINQLVILTLNLIKTDNDFFDLDANNEGYFNTRNSDFLEIRDSLLALIRLEIGDVISQKKERSYDVDRRLLSIDSTLTQYDIVFKELESLLFKRGFKDYGMEGLMRLHAHQLEEESTNIDISELLFLRRNEKDFFLRHDLVYQREFNRRSNNLTLKLEVETRQNEPAIYHLKEYTRIFNQLVSIQTKIGLSSTLGLRNKLNKLTSSIGEQYFALAEFSYLATSAAQERARIFYLIVIACAVGFSLVSGLWLSKQLSEPIAKLSDFVKRAPLHLTSKDLNLNFKNTAIEVNELSQSFLLLIKQASAQMEQLEEKSNLLRKKNKQLKKVNRELDNFLYSTAHDLRSPLSSLLGLINLMRHENKQDQLVIYLDMLEKSINRSDAFIGQIVSFSKNKRMDIHVQKLEMPHLVSEVFESQKFLSGNERIRKDVIINERVPLYSDLSRVTILFNNLISNAIRYADFKRNNCFIKINILVNESEAVIEFIDNGVGIAPEHMDKIFNMFYRANVNSPGSGLGLFIFKETINKLKGFASVESELGVGTKFFIRIPNRSPNVSVQQELQLNAS